MTKKRFSTKKNGGKKQLRRKSRKMQKSMKGGNRAFVEKIVSCIPQESEIYPNLPFSPSGYMNDDDNWTKLAKYIYDKNPREIEFQCEGKPAIIYGKYDDIIKFDYKNKLGTLYGKIGNSNSVILWRNGRQYTYEPPPSINPIQRTNSVPHRSYPAQ